MRRSGRLVASRASARVRLRAAPLPLDVTAAPEYLPHRGCPQQRGPGRCRDRVPLWCGS